ncbi:MAG: hydrogenase formation protein HypD [Bryobacteraceae bacterium]|nr:hydrogenase formation protein HypD [Bryobacteraceae bacterium]MDW8380422.1 hydrogenase formation protein HypD [Bryobacterales bacterium]
MKLLTDYRKTSTVAQLARAIQCAATRPWTLMEICGGQTHSILKFGLDQMLPPGLTLVHGPGCPVCVTPAELIDKAIAIALQPRVIFCSFGDMLRVPGSKHSLLDAKASGADVRVVYSPLDAVKLARENPQREVVFFAVGFETTAPANAMAAWQASQDKLSNFSLLVAQMLVPPAMRQILSSPNCRVQGFLAPGHVCTVEGYVEYERLAASFHVPIVVTGFEPVDLLEGILMVVRQLESGRADVENQYVRVVRREGNPAARAVVQEVFEVSDRHWRGVGLIPSSGLRLREAYRHLDAELRFPAAVTPAPRSELCLVGLVLQGLMKPSECPAFGKSCTPDQPLGAPMVSSEGACSAYYLYGRG